MTTPIEYVAGAELPDLTVVWKDSTGAVIPFGTGWAITARVGKPGAAADIVKATGITPADAAPNVTIGWTAGELDTLAAGFYDVQLTATRNADGKERKMQIPIRILAAVT